MPAILIWCALVAAILTPLIAAGLSPLLAWREPIYIIAGFAGIIGLALMLIQPLLMLAVLPGLSAVRGRSIHRWTGAMLLIAVVVHVAGLWITSPPDVIDALIFNSPTPFSAWGVIAMWAVFATAMLAVFRKRWRLSPRRWRMAHLTLALVIVAGTVVHALLIQGTMELVSKAILCALVAAATIKVAVDLWRSSTRRRTASR